MDKWAITCYEHCSYVTGPPSGLKQVTLAVKYSVCHITELRAVKFDKNSKITHTYTDTCKLHTRLVGPMRMAVKYESDNRFHEIILRHTVYISN